MNNYLILNPKGKDFDFLFSNLIRLGCKRRYTIKKPSWLKNNTVLFCPTKRKNIISRFLNKQPNSVSGFFFKIVSNQYVSKIVYEEIK